MRRPGSSNGFRGACTCRPCRARCWLRFAFAAATPHCRPPWSTRSSAPIRSRRPNPQIQATAQASGWLSAQLADLKTRVDRDQQRLADFESAARHCEHAGGAGQRPARRNRAQLRLCWRSTSSAASLWPPPPTASSARPSIAPLRRATRRWSSPPIRACRPQNGNFATALLAADSRPPQRSGTGAGPAQRRTRPQLSPRRRNRPPVAGSRPAETGRRRETGRALPQQLANRSRPRAVGAQEPGTGDRRRHEAEQAATEYAVMRQEANASHDLYMRVLEKSEEAGLAAGVHSSNISVVDAARQPVKPVAPDLPLYLAITFFAGLWIAVGAALLRESLADSAARAAAMLPCAASRRRTVSTRKRPRPTLRACPAASSTFRRSQETRSLPNPKEAPAVWNNASIPPASRRSPPRNPLRPCPRPSLPATFSTSASTTRPNFIPRCASPLPARSRCP